MAFNFTSIPQRSPFKFLDPYQKEDRALFFGRDAEIEKLYEQLSLSKLIMVYGASGTGKTSLINCGLSNKYSDADWYALFIRRGHNLVQSLYREIRAHALEPISETASLPEAIESLYLDHYIPVYLIFDQFEELFILGDRAEQDTIFQMLASLLRSRAVCKVMIVIREEYLAYFSEFEKVLPVLFDNRFRVERMNQTNLEAVIQGTISAPVYDIELEQASETVALILENLRDMRREVDLTNLQVYLDRLYRQDFKRRLKEGSERSITIDPDLVKEVGKLPQVLSAFLDDQLTLAGRKLGNAGLPIQVLMSLVTNDGTKRSLSLEALQEDLAEKKQLAPADVAACVQHFYESRILRELKV